MRLRFRLRTLLAIVAAVAVVLGAALWAERLLRRAGYYAFVARVYEAQR